MSGQKNRRRRKVRKGRVLTILLTLLLLLVLVATVAFFMTKKKPSNLMKSDSNSSSTSKSSSKASMTGSLSSTSKSSSSSSTSSSTSSDDKISTSASDPLLVLVNLKNPKPEMNPSLATVNGVQVASSIAQAVEEFLAAAQQINPNVHLISGYRSVAYQTELFNGYVQQTLSANPGWTEAQAKAEVMKTSQPPQSSEHETGLAIDISAVDELNAEDSATASGIAQIAPNYGFVLRFPTWGTASTGIDYEDWHFRYVGVANAKYMTAHQLTLEDFLAKLEK